MHAHVMFVSFIWNIEACSVMEVLWHVKTIDLSESSDSFCEDYCQELSLFSLEVALVILHVSSLLYSVVLAM